MLNTISIGYDFPAVNEDGIYGAETASAIARFQAINGLRSNGVTDIHTWNALSDAYAKYLS
jgi:peptidoglycan hydrolase-like protein with peptidoglycan-binding domain